MISSLLKSFFRKLPEPLFTNGEFDAVRECPPVAGNHNSGAVHKQKWMYFFSGFCLLFLQIGTQTSSTPTGQRTPWRGSKCSRGW